MTAPLSRRAISKGRRGGAEASPFWQAHDAELRQFAKQGMTAAEAAERIGTTYASVKNRSQRIGVQWQWYRTPATAFWLARDADLRRYAKEGLTTTQAANLLGVKKGAVIGRAQRLGNVVWAQKPRGKPLRSKPMQRAWEFPEPGRCVYPQGHPDKPGFSFCGDEVAEFGRPYCEHHMAVAYQRIARTEPQPWTVRREPDIGRQWEAAE